MHNKMSCFFAIYTRPHSGEFEKSYLLDCFGFLICFPGEIPASEGDGIMVYVNVLSEVLILLSSCLVAG